MPFNVGSGSVVAVVGSGRVVETEVGAGVAVGVGVAVGPLTAGVDDPLLLQATRRAARAMPPARPSESGARRKRKADLLERREGAHLLRAVRLLL